MSVCVEGLSPRGSCRSKCSRCDDKQVMNPTAMGLGFRDVMPRLAVVLSFGEALF